MEGMTDEFGQGGQGRPSGEPWAAGSGQGLGGRPGSPYGSQPQDAPGAQHQPASGWGATDQVAADTGSAGPGSRDQGTTQFPAAQFPAGPSHSGGYQAGTYPPGSSGLPPSGFPPGGVPPYGPAVPEAGGKKSGRGLVVAGVVAAMLLSGGIGGWVGASIAGGSAVGLPAVINSAQPVSQAPDGTAEAVAAKVLPSVVSIDVRSQSGRGEGSGVVLTADGLIITNNHVIALAAAGGEIQVRFDDGTTAPATIVGSDPATDIAVIKAESADPLVPIALGTSANLVEGQAVAAVGSPLGLSGTVTTGIVSALDRPVRAGGERSDQSTVIDAIQTDAAINPGNSGGALVNMDGELVGINSAIASLGSGSSGSIGLGFAIPVDQARQIADQLIKQGFATRAVLGVSVSDAPGGGALVRGVEAGGPADKAGIRDGAVISGVGDRAIDGGDALVAAIRSQPAGGTVTVTYASREGEQPTTVEVVLGEAR